MNKPNITAGEWSLILEGEYPQLGVRNGHIIIPVIGKLPFETDEQRANANAIVMVPQLIHDLIEARKELITANKIIKNSFLGSQIVRIEKTLIKAGCK